MFIIALFTIIMMLLVNLTSMQLGNRIYHLRNLNSLVLSLSAIVFFTLLLYQQGELGHVGFLGSLLFYLMLVINVSNHMMKRTFIKANEKQLIYEKFSQFIFLALVPLSHYGFNQLPEFDHLNDDTQDLAHLGLCSIVLLVFSFLLFIDKIKNRSCQLPWLMIAMVINSSVVAVLFVKLMQTYHATWVYMVATAFNATIWLCLSLKSKEYRTAVKADMTTMGICAVLYIVYSQLNIYLTELIPADQIIILRALLGVIVAAAFDWGVHRTIAWNRKDALVFLLIVTFMSTYY
jgi:hypothetical protein